ncbi:GNAT family N-acetyltransferase [Liquorilactobacillus satsumensis]|uniref:RibT protein n=1 Tax=Liquorilactobacillus satsumensis DSM 16230 = JCM 12392 TaxID=1423801 RepID=A0A0R1V1E1_9LACO|nr:GNAT family N-acetyltransferase [Liquorilactobacillus satsumensis]KRL99473.1 RibT protein [Liquorilactobacillus satsumensis DSM 16230 = JCM 12392]MCC7665950.1 N-acetyltransferase [Liquorilactobacillus satsumensis]MCP9312090.1 N-acetyltransferase [Liquorilactobacillus satsumensis]MCP9327823.1 N-acetyltransferase [Liquorilactobacillus satsumensis]MCP9356656.1 N-acetyltransferase [Liquorilactobacillus satsumensis]
MLYKYKNDYEKITMGLLSFIPDLKEFSRLKAEIKWYSDDDDRCLFLWKNDTGDFVGVIGVEATENVLMIRHIAVTPAERNEGVSFEMLSDLAILYPKIKMMGSIETAGLIAKWEQRNGK